MARPSWPCFHGLEARATIRLKCYIKFYFLVLRTRLQLANNYGIVSIYEAVLVCPPEDLSFFKE